MVQSVDCRCIQTKMNSVATNIDNGGKDVIHSDVESVFLPDHEQRDPCTSTSKESASDQICHFPFWSESRLLMNIALPSVAVQLSVSFILPQTASEVGRSLGTDELAGYSLGSLVGSLTCLSIMVGALSAADTLMPRAYGAGRFDEVGGLAVRTFFVTFIILTIVIIPLCTIMEWIFDHLGQDVYVARSASQWIRVYSLGVPSVLLFRVVQSFLNAHNAVWPLVYASATACFVFHPIFLQTFVPPLGILGSAMAISLTQFVMAALVILFLYLRPSTYKAEAWPGLTWAFVVESLRPRPVLSVLNLSLGGVFSVSEWWFWEVISFIAGSFGVVPLVVFNIVYTLIPLLFMIPLGIMYGLTVRMGTVLAEGHVRKAKLMAAWSMALTVVLGGLAAILLYTYQISIIKLFTSDVRVIQGCQEIWHKVCYYIVVLYIFGINVAILRALGLQWRIAAVIFVSLWCGALPSIVVVAIRRGGQLDAVWTIVPFFYTVMQFLLMLSYMTPDWTKISDDIRERLAARVERDLPTEDTPLL